MNVEVRQARWLKPALRATSRLPIPIPWRVALAQRLANADRLRATYPDAGPATYALPNARAA